MYTATKNYRNLGATLLTLIACYSAPAANAATCTTLTKETLLKLPDMTVRQDTPIGAEIGTVVVSPPVNTFSCTTGFTYQAVYIKALGTPGAPINGLNIYKFGTANTGIGYAVYGSSRSSCTNDYYPVVTGDYEGLCGVNGTFSKQPMVASLKLVFYKIGPIVPGQKAGQPVAEFQLENNKNTWQHPTSHISTSGFTVKALGCIVGVFQGCCRVAV
ncbi:hypothetical protein [Pseudomonas sp. RA_105y_Pfl2_P56]|uniref:hypothetical protein n=1 Tax=Pseudomonas sp. RA_105y_Pfl2_P56 TaxID=3088701 RepID=UPI0030DDCEC6